MADVPVPLKRLVRLVMRGFYQSEHVLVMDLLIRKPCMKEEDLETLLKFERKQLRQVIAQLKNDKMIKARLRMETGPDGKATKQNYHFINYKAFVSVVKYKLDHMRRKIETEERDSTSRASFICTSTSCRKTFTDLEAGELCDLRTGEFRCSLCGDPVIEDPNVLPKADSRLVLAKFNEQIEPLYLLLKEVEGMVLPSDILEPEPTEPAIKSEFPTTHSMMPATRGWGGGTVKQENYDAQMFQNSTATTVKIENNINETSIITTDKIIKEEPAVEKKPSKKEELPWMKGSTVYEEQLTPAVRIADKENTSINILQQQNSIGEDSASSAKEIMEALMNFEKPQDTNKSALSFLNTMDPFGMDRMEDMSLDAPNVDPNDDEMMDTDDDDFGDDIPQVYVGKVLMKISDVSDDHLDLMSMSEREEYVRLIQDLYSYLYDL